LVRPLGVRWFLPSYDFGMSSASLPPFRETIVPPSAPYEVVTPATEVRGTLITASLTTVREHGLEARYFSLLDPQNHRDIREVVPLSWLSMELALSHYQVMEQLYPTPNEQIENGKATAERTQNTYVRTIMRALKSTGRVDPLELLTRLGHATGRSVRGGGAVAAYRTGPKDARVELVGFPFLSVSYARYGWQGMFESTLGLAATRMFARQDMRFERADRVAYLLSWV
jgi:hypothetical protein